MWLDLCAVITVLHAAIDAHAAAGCMHAIVGRTSNIIDECTPAWYVDPNQAL